MPEGKILDMNRMQREGEMRVADPILSTESTGLCRPVRGLPRRSRWSARTPLHLWESAGGSTVPGGTGGFASSAMR